MKKITRLFLPLILCIFFGTMFYMTSSNEGKTYPSVFLSPPRIIFPFVWTLIYVLIGISIYIFDKKSLSLEENDQGIILYYFDLFFNAIWPLLFFKLKLRIFASFWLALLIVIVFIRFFIMYKKNKLASYFLLPYLVWLSYALYLNIAILLV